MPRAIINAASGIVKADRVAASGEPWRPWPGDPEIEYRRFRGGYEARCAKCQIPSLQTEADPEPKHAPGCKDYGKWHHGKPVKQQDRG